MKIYIAGKITGDRNYRRKFAEAEKTLRDEGHVVLNPAVLPSGLANQDYMSICKAMIDAADMIVMLPDHCDSWGATLELKYADYIKKPAQLMRTEDECQSFR